VIYSLLEVPPRIIIPPLGESYILLPEIFNLLTSLIPFGEEINIQLFNTLFVISSSLNFPMICIARLVFLLSTLPFFIVLLLMIRPSI